jgi:protein-S-isoprenylcysteine O-methyltransferase Ste14
MAIFAYASIIGIMFNGAQRLEKRQMARYGNLPAYRAYADKTPILLPLVPLYHLNREK